MSQSIAAITAGAFTGGVIGLVAGLILGAGNPFFYAAVGIALGGGLAIPFIMRRG